MAGHDVTSEEFQELFMERLEPHAAREIRLEGLTVATAVTLISQLQLALRHPGNRGHTFKTALAFTRRLIDAVAGDDEVLRRGLEAGFDPKCDIPTSEGG